MIMYLRAGEICTISGASQLQVKFGITEKIHQTMELGDSVTLEKNGVDYTGTVTEIGSMVNESSGLYDARAMCRMQQVLRMVPA